MRINWFSLFREPDVESIKRVVDRVYRVKGVRQKDAEAVAEALVTYAKDTGFSANAITDALKKLFSPQYGTMAITQKDSNDPSPNTYNVTAHPSGNDTLNPPASLPTGSISGGGYYKATGFEAEGESAGITVVNSELVIAEDGLYIINVGWGSFRHTLNNSTVSFVLGVDDGTNINFSLRPTASEQPNGNALQTISGGGQARFKAGDKLSVWVASDTTGVVTLGNANLTLAKYAN